MLRISQDFGYPNGIVREWQVPTGIEQTKGESAGGSQTIKLISALFADPIVGKTSATYTAYHKILVCLYVQHFSDLINVVRHRTMHS